MQRVVRVARYGGPEVMELVDMEKPAIGTGQVRVRTAYAAVNMIDTYHRKGLYPVDSLPFTPGKETVGVVEEVGSSVTGRFKPGDRVAALLFPEGQAYSTHVLVSASHCLTLPPHISDLIASAALLKGLTARFLVKETFPIRPGHVALVYAAAGGTGQILLQWITALGGHVIAVTSTPEKADIARALGAKHTILSSENISARVREIFPNGVDVCYDSVGKDTIFHSLDSLRPRGMCVSYGNASGPVEPISPLELAKRGSLFLTRPSLQHYIPDSESLEIAAADFFNAIETKMIVISPPTVFPLSEAARAHETLESRQTTGSLVLDASK